MKVELLHLDSANKPSPISKGVTEIQINSQPCKGINLTTWHTRPTRAPRVVIVHDTVKGMIRAHLTLVHVFHTYASADTPWVAHVLTHCTPVRYGRIASVLVMGIPYVPYAPVHNQVFVHSDPTDVDLNWHRRGLPPWSSEFQIRPLILLPIHYSSLPPNCPARSHI
jgi:hypothetical protein